MLIHIRNAVSISWDPGSCQFLRLVPHPLGRLSLLASREKQSAGSWTTSLLQLGQSFLAFHGVLCQLLLLPLLPLPIPLPPLSPPPPPLESDAMIFAFCVMISDTCLRCSARASWRSVRGSKVGGTGVRGVVSKTYFPEPLRVIPQGSRCRGRA